jgi:hypothetical protein
VSDDEQPNENDDDDNADKRLPVSEQIRKRITLQSINIISKVCLVAAVVYHAYVLM